MRTTNTQRTFVVAALAAAALLTVAACKKPAAKTGAEAETFGAAPVKIFKAARERITEKITYTGTLEALDKINITPETGGKIARIHVEAGDRVAKGQLLAELETESIRLQLRQAEAGVAVAEAELRRRPQEQGAHGPAAQGERRLRAAVGEDPAGLRRGGRAARAGPGRPQPGPARTGPVAHEGPLRRHHRLEERRGRRRHQPDDGRRVRRRGRRRPDPHGLCHDQAGRGHLLRGHRPHPQGPGGRPPDRLDPRPRLPRRRPRRQPDRRPPEQEVRGRGPRPETPTRPSGPARSATSSSRSSPTRTPWSCPRRPSSRIPTSSSSRAARPSARTSRSASRTRPWSRSCPASADGESVIVEGNYGLEEGAPVQVLEEVKK